jgi:hypothetical protein
MRKMSLQRRRVAVLAGSLAALSGTGPVLLQKHLLTGRVWAVAMVTLAAWAIVLTVLLLRKEGCR